MGSKAEANLLRPGKRGGSAQHTRGQRTGLTGKYTGESAQGTEGNFANFDGVGRDVNTKHNRRYFCSPVGKAWGSISHTRIPKILALF